MADYLNSIKSKHPDLSDLVSKLVEEYRNKLWHQVTSRIETLLEHPSFQNPAEQTEFYRRFIESSLDSSKLNPLEYARITISIANRITEPPQAVEFLTKASAKLGGSGTGSSASAAAAASSAPPGSNVLLNREARVQLTAELASMHLSAGNDAAAKALLADAQKTVESQTGLDARVYASYYRAAAELQKLKGTPAEFYRKALLYLAYVNLDSLPLPSRKQWAFSMSLAALIGENVYNFGELLSHPIIESLQGTPEVWIVQLLRTFNAGDMAGYKQLSSKYAAELQAQADLVAHQQRLTEKITILGLMELAFRLPADQRIISFDRIVSATGLPAADQVEHLVMKALSLGLVRGSIDEVDRTVAVTWVQPRVLTLEQVGAMQARLQEWSDKVKETMLFVEDQGKV